MRKIKKQTTTRDNMNSKRKEELGKTEKYRGGGEEKVNKEKGERKGSWRKSVERWIGK